jgi:uncharacterized membrane protein YqgA involved in biofilm formation
MKTLFAAAIAAAFFVPVALGVADAAPPVVDNGVVGILSPNGTFKPLHNSIVQSSTQTSKYYQGVITTTISITATTPVLGGLQCGVTAAVSGVSAAGLADTVIDTASAVATGSGTSYTCVVTQPYKWGLFANTGTPTTKDSVTMSYQITSVGGAGERLVSSSFAVMSVPANNATTSFAVPARI